MHVCSARTNRSRKYTGRAALGAVTPAAGKFDDRTLHGNQIEPERDGYTADGIRENAYARQNELRLSVEIQCAVNICISIGGRLASAAHCPSWPRRGWSGADSAAPNDTTANCARLMPRTHMPARCGRPYCGGEFVAGLW